MKTIRWHQTDSHQSPGYPRYLLRGVAAGNIFHNIENDTYISFFTKEEIQNLFNAFETISISEEYFLDLGGLEPHYSGVIKYIGRKLQFTAKLLKS